MKINHYLSELFRLFPLRNSRHESDELCQQSHRSQDWFTAIRFARHLFLLN